MGGGVGWARDYQERENLLARSKGFKCREEMYEHEEKKQEERRLRKAKAEPKQDKKNEALSKTELNKHIQSALKKAKSVPYHTILVCESYKYIPVGKDLVHKKEFVKQLKKELGI